MFKLSSLLTKNTRGLLTTGLTLLAIQVSPQASAYDPYAPGDFEPCTTKWDHANGKYLCLTNKWTAGFAPTVSCVIPKSEVELCAANPEDPNCNDPLILKPIFKVPSDSCTGNGGIITSDPSDDLITE